MYQFKEKSWFLSVITRNYFYKKLEYANSENLNQWYKKCNLSSVFQYFIANNKFININKKLLD